MSDVIDNSKIPSIEKYDNRIRVSNYDLTRFGNERFLDLLCAENPELPEVTRFTETDYFRVDFSGAYFDDIEFNDCTFTECNFEKAVFDDSAFNIVKFTDCDLTGITGEIAIIENGSEFRDCDITGSELRVKSLLIINSHKGIDVVN